MHASRQQASKDERWLQEVRGLPFMTSALRGRGKPSKADIVSNLSMGGCVHLQTGGVKKSEIFADVINGSPLTDYV